MKKESSDQILQACDEVCLKLQFESFSLFLRYASRKMEEQLRLVKQVRNRRDFEALLARQPDPSPEELATQLTVIRTFLYSFRKHLPAAAKEAAKKIPHPPGGRKKAFKDVEECRTVCTEISDLIIKKGFKTKDA